MPCTNGSTLRYFLGKHAPYRALLGTLVGAKGTKTVKIWVVAPQKHSENAIGYQADADDFEASRIGFPQNHLTRGGFVGTSRFGNHTGTRTVTETLNELLERMFVGPVWPASLLISLMVIYSLIAMLGLVDLDMNAPDADMSVDADFGMDADLAIDGDMSLDADGFTPDLEAGTVDMGGPDIDLAQPGTLEFISGIMATTVRWTNFGRVPMVIWMGIFSFMFWLASYVIWHVFDANRYEATLLPSALLSIRNFVIAVVATKYLTLPLADKFNPPPNYDSRRLMGQTCTISSHHASSAFGQAKFATDTAPLLLNIRTKGPELLKGTKVRIIDFDPSNRIYTVVEITPETES